MQSARAYSDAAGVVLHVATSEGIFRSEPIQDVLAPKVHAFTFEPVALGFVRARALLAVIDNGMGAQIVFKPGAPALIKDIQHKSILLPVPV